MDSGLSGVRVDSFVTESESPNISDKFKSGIIGGGESFLMKLSVSGPCFGFFCDVAVKIAFFGLPFGAERMPLWGENGFICIRVWVAKHFRQIETRHQVKITGLHLEVIWETTVGGITGPREGRQTESTSIRGQYFLNMKLNASSSSTSTHLSEES